MLGGSWTTLRASILQTSKYSEVQRQKAENNRKKFASLFYRSSCDLITDDEKYFSLDRDNMPGSARFYSYDKSKCPNNNRFTKNIRIW